MGRAAHEATAAARASEPEREDTPPPAPPHELPRDTPAERRFERAGEPWLVRVAGKSAYGTGSYGLGLIEAVHFCDPEQPDQPLREALLPRGRFEMMFDDELVRLLDESVPIVRAEEKPR